VETLLIALAGGSIGVLLTLLLSVPADVRHHDRQAYEYDDDLGQWVSDERVRLERELERHRNEMAGRGQLYSGAYLRGIAHIKEACLHAYRDQERDAERKRAALRDAEGWRHRLWRAVAPRHSQLPELRSPERVTPILDQWRAEVDFRGDKAPVSDPTRRPLEWALKKYPLPPPGNA
jgi:hypothetical protein